METQVQGDTAIIATNNVVVRNGSPVLITGDNEGIYLKSGQYAGVGIKNGGYIGDALMVKMTKSEFNNAKRYKVNAGDISVDNMTFDDFVNIAKSQQNGGNQYKKYAIAIYDNRIETSVGRKGRRIV